jgi:hypothetical protein
VLYANRLTLSGSGDLAVKRDRERAAQMLSFAASNGAAISVIEHAVTVCISATEDQQHCRQRHQKGSD